MIDINLKAVPNQTTSMNVDGLAFGITINSAEFMVADISIDDVIVSRSVRCLPARPLIPYPYLENGNFYFITKDGEVPNWHKFGISQFLVYATPSEVEALNAT